MNNSTPPPLHREHFEHWLFSQPIDRVIQYDDCLNCVLCQFAQEVYFAEITTGNTGYLSGGRYYPLPPWFAELVAPEIERNQVLGETNLFLTCGELQKRWLTLFPTTLAPVVGDVLPTDATGRATEVDPAATSSTHEEPHTPGELCSSTSKLRCAAPLAQVHHL